MYQSHINTFSTRIEWIVCQLITNSTKCLKQSIFLSLTLRSSNTVLLWKSGNSLRISIVFISSQFDSLYYFRYFVLSQFSELLTLSALMLSNIHAYSLRTKEVWFIVQSYSLRTKQLDALYIPTVFVLSSWMHCTFLQSSY